MKFSTRTFVHWLLALGVLSGAASAQTTVTLATTEAQVTDCTIGSGTAASVVDNGATLTTRASTDVNATRRALLKFDTQNYCVRTRDSGCRTPDTCRRTNDRCQSRRSDGGRSIFHLHDLDGYVRVGERVKEHADRRAPLLPTACRLTRSSSRRHALYPAASASSINGTTSTCFASR